MFRKRTKKAVKNIRKRNDDEDQNKEGDDDDEATGIAIRKTIKKQKILASLPLTSMGTIPENSNRGNRSSSDQMLPLAAATAAPTSVELSVLASKHVSNMEAFIEERMAATRTAVSESKGNQSSTANGMEEKTRGVTNTIITEEDLYQQLAREVTDSGDRNNSDTNNSQPQKQQQQNDGDQGDGGAALLVGTGIAEVILPATNHRPAAVPSRAWSKNSNLLSSAVPEGERHKHTMPKTTPKPFVKFRKNYNTLPQNNDSNPSSSNHDGRNRNGLNNPQGSHEQTPATGSTVRKGFDAFRGKVPAFDKSNEEGNDHRDRNPHQNDRRKTGKDRDDQVYSHFLKNALNGKNRR